MIHRRLALLALALVVMPLRAQSIFTVAGGRSEDGRHASFATFTELSGVAIDPRGDIYIADRDRSTVRKIDRVTGIITTVAGNGSDRFSGDQGPAALAGLRQPRGIDFDRAGNLYIADYFSFRVRKVSAETGRITTIAGGGTRTPATGVIATEARASAVYDVAVSPNGEVYFVSAVTVFRIAGSALEQVAGNARFGFSGDGGPATLAMFVNPEGICFDARGNLIVVDTGNHRVRKVEAGIVTTIAGGGSSLGDGGPATAASLSRPRDALLDSRGNLLIVDQGNRRIRTIDPQGNISTLAGGGASLGDGGPATAARLDEPRGAAFDAAGNLYIADFESALLSDPSADGTDYNRVRRVDPRGIITTIAGGSKPPLGDGAVATAASLYEPYGVAVDQRGNLWIADMGNARIRRVDAITGVISTVAGTGTHGFSGDNGPATAARLASPSGIAVDPAGNLFIADKGNHRIRRVSAANGVITTIAGRGNGSFGGDGGPATAATLNTPAAVALDRSGNLYIGDSLHYRVRKVSVDSGVIATIAGIGVKGTVGDGGPATAARIHDPRGVFVDSAGNVFLADREGQRVRRVDGVSSIITTIVGSGNQDDEGLGRGDGGPATAAWMNDPYGVVVDDAGVLYVADSNSQRVRRVANGIITSYAGGGSRGISGDDGAATAAAVGHPRGLAIDGHGDVYLTQSDRFTAAYSVRKVPSCKSITNVSLASPADGSSGVSTAPRFAWTASVGAFRYDVLIDTANPPRTVVAEDLRTATYSPSNLEPLTTYYWQIVAKGDPYCPSVATSRSIVRSFTTGGECGVPGPVSAASGSVGER